MNRNLLLLVISLVMISCGSGKSVAGRSKNGYRKGTTTAVRTSKKAPARNVAGKPVEKTAAQKQIQRQYEEAKVGQKQGNETVYSKQEILEATTRVKVTTAMVLDYIAQYRDIAKANMQQYGIPASIILGQGILESGSGTGPLSAIANNHFGIKCHKEWTGESVLYDDDAAQECFRKYDHPAQSYQDHSLFLTSRSRYASLFELDKDDYKAWARGLKAAGYATDVKYPEKLISIIERYQLNKYDAEVLGTEFTAAETPERVIAAEVYQVAKGDTLYSISKKFNMSIDDLRRKNNITDNVISIGQNLIIR